MPEQLHERLALLEGCVDALVKSVGRPGAPGKPLATAHRGARRDAVDQERIKAQIRADKLLAKQHGASIFAPRLEQFKRQIELEKLWDKFEMLGTKWRRWGGGFTDPVPHAAHERLINEIRDLQRKVAVLRGRLG